MPRSRQAGRPVQETVPSRRKQHPPATKIPRLLWARSKRHLRRARRRPREKAKGAHQPRPYRERRLRLPLRKRGEGRSRSSSLSGSQSSPDAIAPAASAAPSRPASTVAYSGTMASGSLPSSSRVDNGSSRPGSTADGVKSLSAAIDAGDSSCSFDALIAGDDSAAVPPGRVFGLG